MFFFLEANQDPIGTIMGPGFASSGKKSAFLTEVCTATVHMSGLEHHSGQTSHTSKNKKAAPVVE